MARKQLGAVDDGLLDRVDARAAELGQTRRVFTERALARALEAGPTAVATADRAVEHRPGTSSSSSPASSPIPSAPLRAHAPDGCPSCFKYDGPPKNGRPCPKCGARRTTA